MSCHDHRTGCFSCQAWEGESSFKPKFFPGYAFDCALYPFEAWKLGPVVGGGIMALASLLFCLVPLRIYDGLRRDWLGTEFVKGLRHYEGTSRWRRVLAWLLARGDGVAFFVLSAKYDPFSRSPTCVMEHSPK